MIVGATEWSEANDQNEEHGRGEHNNDRPPTNDHQERDDQEESNVTSRQDQQDTSRPSELEVGALRMAQEMQTMKEKMDMMMSAIRGRVSANLDKLVHHTDSPFTASFMSFPFPTKFRMPQVEAYDGSKDLLNHLESFKTLMHLQGVPDEIMCKALPTTLKWPAWVWFSKIVPNSASTFKELNGPSSHILSEVNDTKDPWQASWTSNSGITRA